MQAEATITQQDLDTAINFDGVFQQELNQLIRPKRKNKTSLPNDLVGLAFSGGGIRSATFNLGVLQALSNANLLNKLDYLSTVSGGGYVGAFFTSMLARPRLDGARNTIEEVQEKLRTDNKLNGQEALEVSFLRQYSNYLTPKIGLSTDAFAAISVWFTNTLLNQIILISFLMAISASVFLLNQCLLGLHGVSNWVQYVGVGTMLLAGFLVLQESTQTTTKQFRQSRWQIILGVGMVGAILFALWLAESWQYNPKAWWHFHFDLRISPYWLILPTLVLVISTLIVVSIGFAGRQISKCLQVTSFMREWWARLGGVTLFIGLWWLAVFVCILYLPLKLDAWLTTSPISSFSVTGLWGIVTWLAVHLGNSPSTNGLQPNKLKERLTALLPWLAILGLIVFVSFGTYHLNQWLPNNWFVTTKFASIALAAALVGLVFAWRVDINIFSLHYFYRNRLTRAYLGATQKLRCPSAFTGFDEGDDLEFYQCKQRPLHIVNTALNLTNTKNLAWQQRKAASFTFTPMFSGYEFPDKTGAYRPTCQFTNPNGGVKLGSIMAVSGAAASPNMGYHSSSAAAFLMTMFNVRLGRWYGNPALQNAKNPRQSTWLRQSPALGFACLLKELFAKTKEDDDYIYCSDGGHFENLGIYELVRRRCKLIIAVDVGQDGADKFEDLGNAIRKCQVDLGVQIDMRVDTVRKDPVTGLSPKHYALANITYPKSAQSDFEQGVLIYIKSSLTGDEPADIQNFKKEEPAFPHHSTADQFFDEKQFESYRHLGQHVMQTTLDELTIKQALMQPNALAQSNMGVSNQYMAVAKSSAGSVSQPVAAHNLQTLVKQLAKQASMQIKESTAQNKPLDIKTKRATQLNASDKKLKI